MNIKYNLSILAIFKNEKPYLQEWIDTHIKLGVSHFYLYDDESNDQPLQILQKYINDGLVTYHKIVRRNPNNPTIFLQGKRWVHLTHFFTNYKNETRWVLHCDCDEFFYSKQNNKNLVDVLEYFSSLNKDCLLIFPREFGCRVNSNNINIPCIKRFQYRGPIASYTKCIVNPLKVDVLKLNNPHYLHLLPTYEYYYADITGSNPIQINTAHIDCGRNNTVEYPIYKPIHTQIIGYNHYRYKSFVEFSAKCEKYKHNHWNKFYKQNLYKSYNSKTNKIPDSELYNLVSLNTLHPKKNHKNNKTNIKKQPQINKK